MPSRDLRTAIDCGDVLIVGAGVAGVLQARSLARAGLRCTLIDAVGIGAQQSGHHHGYLHLGHAYIDPSMRFIEELKKAHEAWRPLLDEVGAQSISSTSRVVLSNPFTRDRQVALWEAGGLLVRDAPTPRCLTVAGTAFETREPTYDFTPILRGLRDRLDGVVTIRAHATRLLTRDGRVLGAEALYDRRHVRLLAGQTLLAAGAGNLQLLRSATAHGGRALVRTSYMMVLRSSELPPASWILPEPTATGLFVVSRPAPDGGNVWLISNFVSFPRGGSPRLGQDWATALISTLRALSEIPYLPDLELGWYAARKAELRDDARDLGLYAHEDHGLKGVLALSPTKITFAPLLAESVTPLVLDRMGTRPVSGVEAETLHQRLEVQDERWRSVDLRPLRSSKSAS